MESYSFYFDFEISLIKFLQTFSPSLAIILSKICNIIGGEIVVASFLLCFYLCFDKDLGRKVFINALSALVLGSELKNIVKRTRPYFVSDEVKCLIPVDASYDIYDLAGQGYSFPSLHTVNVVTIFGSLTRMYKKKSILIVTIIISFFVGLSRIITANHFPTDVLFGALIGIVVIFLFDYLQEKLEKKKLYLCLFLFFSLGFIFCKSIDYFSSFGVMSGFFVADLFDEKYVNFKNTRNAVKIILRLILAAISFLSISELLKLVFVDNGDFISFVLRWIRYFIATFVTGGLCPILYNKNIFKLDDKV